jgi:Ran GTPase-activating protein (RanGAP) involved in mRNA processing and transport
MSDNALTMLSEGLKSNTVLTDLFFTHNDLVSEGGDGGMAFIQSLSNKKDLKSLAINSCNLNGKLLEELEKSISPHSNLRELYLFANKIDPDGAKHISAILKNKTKLTCLGLSNNKLLSPGASEIATAIAGKREITKLSIENNLISNAGLMALSKALKECSMIQEIYLYNNELDDEPIEDFCKVLAKN